MRLILRRGYVLFYILFFVFACQSPQPARNINLPAIFSDHMVLQQEINIPIWGTAQPGGQVTVIMHDQEIQTIVDKMGKWKAVLDPIKAGGPFELIIAGQETIHFYDVLVGEVWIGSGQSNMEMPLAGWGKVLNYETEIAKANYNDIRLFQVKRAMSIDPITEVPAERWKVCTPENIPLFSSTAYFFGREIHKNLKVPVGLIHSSWGGTEIEAWMSAQSLDSIPEFKKTIDQLKELQNEFRADDQNMTLLNIFESIWKKRIKEIQEKDRGLKNAAKHWATTDLDTKSWDTMILPQTWEDAGLEGLDGIVWFRKEVNLSTDSQIILNLSPIDDIDSTYFNGILVGSSSIWDEPRTYMIPKHIIKKGKNIITVRVQDDIGGGGIWGDPNLLSINIGKRKIISLAGKWKYRIGLDFEELTTPDFSPGNPNHPTLLSNAMIDPLIPYSIRGVIWYQGEANTDRAYQYRKLFPGLIRDWRLRWSMGNFPFLFVQLANYMAEKPEPEEHSWAELREAQLMTLSEPNTGMAVTIDIGDANDIHPKNKQEVGHRLALNALNKVYKQDIVHMGPVFNSMEIKREKVFIRFANIGNGLVCPKSKDLTGFYL